MQILQYNTWYAVRSCIKCTNVLKVTYAASIASCCFLFELRKKLSRNILHHMITSNLILKWMYNWCACKQNIVYYITSVPGYSIIAFIYFRSILLWIVNWLTCNHNMWKFGELQFSDLKKDISFAKVFCSNILIYLSI